MCTLFNYSQFQSLNRLCSNSNSNWSRVYLRLVQHIIWLFHSYNEEAPYTFDAVFVKIVFSRGSLMLHSDGVTCKDVPMFHLLDYYSKDSALLLVVNFF